MAHDDWRSTALGIPNGPATRVEWNCYPTRASVKPRPLGSACPSLAAINLYYTWTSCTNLRARDIFLPLHAWDLTNTFL